MPELTQFTTGQITKFEIVKSTEWDQSATCQIAVKDYPKKGDLTLITELLAGVYQTLLNVNAFSSTARFAVLLTPPMKQGKDAFYTSRFNGRFEYYPAVVSSSTGKVVNQQGLPDGYQKLEVSPPFPGTESPDL